MNLSVSQLLVAVASVMPADRYRLQRKLHQLHHTGTPNLERALREVAAQIEQAQHHVQQRRERLPTPNPHCDLPIDQHRRTILDALTEHPVLVVCGETGSGKSTQLPQLALQAGRGIMGYIGHTQPRRLAARSVAERIAYELGCPLGQQVGYAVRFKDQVSADSYIKVMTDGILLAEIQRDRLLHRYDTLIIDEAHERSLNIDFLLGYLKHILPKRPDLKIIITSATIDPQRFSRFFNQAPVIEVSGRSYPVEVRYRPLAEDHDKHPTTLAKTIAASIKPLLRERAGDILVFLPGEREIRETARQLRQHAPTPTDILPLFARLSLQEQQRLFTPHQGPRIVLATNVAETSITVPGIRYVIDSGLARISRYSHRHKVQRLPIEKISQASAKQRAGRCGRISAGVCIRLYDEADYLNRTEFTDPEIRRVNLASVILQMHALRVGKIESFEFLDRPDDKSIRDGYRLLEELGALQHGKITAVGKQLSRLPLDPRLGRILIAAQQHQCLQEALILVSGLSIQDPRERPLDKPQRAQQRHAEFADPRSDFVSLLNLWRLYQTQRAQFSKTKQRHFCQTYFLSWLRMEEWHAVHQHLRDLLLGQGATINIQPADYSRLHQVLLNGFAGQIGMRDESRMYRGPRGLRFQLFPGSPLAKQPPKWLMAAALIETGTLYAHVVAEIEPEWVEAAVPELIKHHYYDPHWNPTSAQVNGYERTSLYGLVLCNKRRIHYAPHDPEYARELFIREALIQGRYRHRAAFYTHNQELIAALRRIEDKLRRPDSVIDEDKIFEFYQQRLPPTIYSGTNFETWYRQAAAEQPELLFMRRDDIVRTETPTDVEAMPDHLAIGKLQLPLSYHFAPGAEDDGVSVRIPLTQLAHVPDAAFTYLVPGLRLEKLIALIKLLPKSQRRHVVPAPDYARACLNALDDMSPPFSVSAADCLERISGITISPQDWDERQLPDHLRMRFEITDMAGNVIAQGRDLEQLRRQLHSQTLTTFTEQIRWDLPTDTFSDWPSATLPRQIETLHHGQRILGYPTVVNSPAGFAIQVMARPDQAEQTCRRAAQSWFLQQLHKESKYLRKNLPNWTQTCLYFASLYECGELTQELLDCTVEQIFFHDMPTNGYDRHNLEQALASGRSRVVAAATRLAESLHTVAQSYHRIGKLLTTLPISPTRQDIEQQLAWMFYPGFIRHTHLPWRDYLSRYCKGIEIRLQRAVREPSKDTQKANQVTNLWSRFTKLDIVPERQSRLCNPLLAYRWLMEEYRIAVFAQELKTAQRVSIERLEAQWQQCNLKSPYSESA